MEYYTLLLFGGLVGMQHALEADHLAAVAAMSAGRSSRRALILRGSFWGVGHTATLLTICGMLILWGGTISERTQSLLELAVAVMIMGLGGNVLYRLWRQRPHFHFHRHGPRVTHLHAHVHEAESIPHTRSAHAHGHESLGLKRAIMVGMVHGTAGSAGLLVLAASAGTMVEAISYVLAFGAGSILGMAALSFVASYPLGFLEKCAGWMNTAALATIGCAAMFIGLRLFTENWVAL